MRILMFCNPMPGHLLPMLPLARALRQQGHVVGFVTSAHMAGSVEPDGFRLIAAGPSTEAVVAEVARRSGSDILARQSPELVGQFFAGARVDLSVDEALAEAREWEPGMIVSEHCDYVGPLVAAALKVPSAVMAIDPALEPDVLHALAETVGSRYLERGLEAPADTSSGRWLLDLCPPSLQRGGVLQSPDRMALRPEPHQAPAGSHARREPRTPAGPGCWSASAPPLARHFGSGRCCALSAPWTSTWWRHRGASPSTLSAWTRNG